MTARVTPNQPLVLSRTSVRAVDAAAVDDYGIPGIVLMENAARGVAALALSALKRTTEATIWIACGRGNNGGDGYAAARHLHNAGHRPRLISLGPPRAESDAAVNSAICRRMLIPACKCTSADRLPAPDLVIDAIFGTGLDRAPSGDAAALIERVNEARCEVIAVDLPSGLDCDTGAPLGPTVRATRTATLVAMKPGLLTDAGRAYAGEVVVVDIGAPMELIEQLARSAGRSS